MYGILTVILQLQSKILYIKLFIEKIKVLLFDIFRYLIRKIFSSEISYIPMTL